MAGAHPGRLVPVRLDVTDHDRIAAVVADTAERYGRIDVLVNNAGRGLLGAVEEYTDRELRDLMDLHFFGPAALTRAVLPHMRERGAGAVVQMSSMGGRFTFPGVGAYSATKFALEGLSEALAKEVAGFGIKVLIVEPGAFRTSFAERGALAFATALPVYDGIVGPVREGLPESSRQAARRPGEGGCRDPGRPGRRADPAAPAARERRRRRRARRPGGVRRGAPDLGVGGPFHRLRLLGRACGVPLTPRCSNRLADTPECPSGPWQCG